MSRFSKWNSDIENAKKIENIEFGYCLLSDVDYGEYEPEKFLFENTKKVWLDMEKKNSYVDPDRNSIKLYRYYELFLSRELPDGLYFQFKTKRDHGTLQSMGEDIILTGDYIGPSKNDYFNEYNNKKLSEFLKVTRTFAGNIVWPKKQVDNRITVNQYKGNVFNERMDLLLFELERFYKEFESKDCVFPRLGQIFKDHIEWYKHFVDFNGFINFFYLQDFVNKVEDGFEATFVGSGSYSSYLEEIGNVIIKRERRLVKDYDKIVRNKY